MYLAVLILNVAVWLTYSLRELSSLRTDKIEKQTATIIVSNVMRIHAIVSLFACQIANSLIHNGTLCFQHCISTNISDLNALQFLFLSKSKFRRCTRHTKYSILSDISIVDLIRIYSTHIQYWKYLNNLKLIFFSFIICVTIIYYCYHSKTSENEN